MATTACPIHDGFNGFNEYRSSRIADGHQLHFDLPFDLDYTGTHRTGPASNAKSG